MGYSEAFIDLILLYGIAVVVLIVVFYIKFRSKITEFFHSSLDTHSKSKRGLPPVEKFLLACQSGHVDEVKRLLNKGVNVDSTLRPGGKTGLMLASASGHVDTVRLLLKWADVNITGGRSGKTALIRAAENSELEVVRLLLGRGANINSRSSVTGKTALIGAVDNGSLEMTQFLIDAGADLNVKNNYAKTAADIAFEKGFDMILTLLKIYGGQLSRYSDNEKEQVPTSPADKYFAVLGCKKTDSNEVIKARYRTLVKEYHPDTIQGKGLPADFIEFANERFQLISEAYQHLIKHNT